MAWWYIEAPIRSSQRLPRYICRNIISGLPSIGIDYVTRHLQNELPASATSCHIKQRKSPDTVAAFCLEDVIPARLYLEAERLEVAWSPELMFDAKTGILRADDHRRE